MISQYVNQLENVRYVEKLLEDPTQHQSTLNWPVTESKIAIYLS